MEKCRYIDGHCDLSCELYHSEQIIGIEALTEEYKAIICHNEAYLPKQGKTVKRCQAHESLTARAFHNAISGIHF